jgi:hypothetical protein
VHGVRETVTAITPSQAEKVLSNHKKDRETQVLADSMLIVYEARDVGVQSIAGDEGETR